MARSAQPACYEVVLASYEFHKVNGAQPTPALLSTCPGETPMALFSGSAELMLLGFDEWPGLLSWHAGRLFWLPLSFTKSMGRQLFPGFADLICDDLL